MHAEHSKPRSGRAERLASDGTVRNFWVPANYTPDGGPDQAAVRLLFTPWEPVGSWEYYFPAPPTYSDPIIELCATDDAACNARYDGTYVATRLITTVAPDRDAVELGLIGPFTYTPPSPLPEPLPCALFIIGLALTAGASRRRALTHRQRREIQAADRRPSRAPARPPLPRAAA